MFTKQQIGWVLSWFFLFQWIWGSPGPVYAYEEGETKVLCMQEGGGVPPFFPNDLMEHEEWLLLRGLDSFCADTWCEGSFDFQFHSFKCSFKESGCLMSYKMKEYGSNDSLHWSSSFICVIKAMDRKELFGTEADFWISPSLYSMVTECIERGEILMNLKKHR